MNLMYISLIQYIMKHDFHTHELYISLLQYIMKNDLDTHEFNYICSLMSACG